MFLFVFDLLIILLIIIILCTSILPTTINTTTTTPTTTTTTTASISFDKNYNYLNYILNYNQYKTLCFGTIYIEGYMVPLLIILYLIYSMVSLSFFEYNEDDVSQVGFDK